MRLLKRIVLFGLSLLFFVSCQADKEAGQLVESLSRNYQHIQGETMGTYFKISYYDSLSRSNELQNEINELLVEMNMELSTYIPESSISSFNKSTTTFKMPGNVLDGMDQQKEHFRINYGVAKDVFKKTQGAFDPTVMPLVNYWGFGTIAKQLPTNVDSAEVSKIRAYVGMDKITYQLGQDGKAVLTKEHPKVELDFSAIAKGYAVDELANFLLKKRIRNFMVDIGGELRLKGKNNKSQDWKIGISKPDPKAKPTDLCGSVTLSNKALATSGNYRNFHLKEGKQYGHTINPSTGYPQEGKVLSSTVIHDKCMIADAYCTAFMVLDPEASIAIAERDPKMELLLLYLDDKGEIKEQYTTGMKKYMSK